MNKFIILFMFFAFPAFANMQIQKIETDIGITALLLENKTNPIVSVRINFSTGSAYDAKNKQGLSDLYAAVLDKGAGDYDAGEFQQQLFENSIDMEFSSSTEDFSISLKTLKSNYQSAFSLLRESLQNPHFPKDEVELAKKQIAASIKINQEQPSNEIFTYFKKAVFGDHPYGYGDNDILHDINGLSVWDLKEYKKRFAKDNIIIGISGDINEAEVKEIIERTFAFLPQNTPQKKLAPAVYKLLPETEIIHRDSKQSAIMFGLPWVNRKSKEFFTGYILNYILGGSGMDSALMQGLREKQGLTYGISTFLAEYKEISMLMGYAVSSPINAQKLITQAKDLMANFTISEQQLNQAKSYLIGAFPLTLVSTMTTANLLITIQEYDLGLDYFTKRNEYINNVSVDEINNFAKKILDITNMDFIIIGESK